MAHNLSSQEIRNKTDKFLDALDAYFDARATHEWYKTTNVELTLNVKREALGQAFVESFLLD